MLLQYVLKRSTSQVVRMVLAVSILVRTPMQKPRQGLHDLRVLPLNDVLELRVWWVDRPSERGPSYSVFAGNVEVLRADLFEVGAHLHPVKDTLLGLGGGAPRQYLFDRGVEALIDRGCAELTHNLAVHLAGHPSKRVRRSLPSQDELDRSSAWLRATMLELDEQYR